MSEKNLSELYNTLRVRVSNIENYLQGKHDFVKPSSDEIAHIAHLNKQILFITEELRARDQCIWKAQTLLIESFNGKII